MYSPQHWSTKQITRQNWPWYMLGGIFSVIGKWEFDILFTHTEAYEIEIISSFSLRISQETSAIWASLPELHGRIKERIHCE